MDHQIKVLNYVFPPYWAWL